MPPKGGRWYAVRVGHQPGVYSTWEEAKAQTNNYPAARHKSFASYEEAVAWQQAGSTQMGKAPRQPSQMSAQRHQPYPEAGGAGAGGSASKHKQNKPPPVLPGSTIGATPASGALVASGTAPPTTKAPSQQPGPALRKPPPEEVVAQCRTRGRAVTLPPGLTISTAPGAYLMSFDGGSRGNPGKAGSGAHIAEVATGKEVAGLTFTLPYGSTNNEAEFCGLILGIEACAALGMVEPRIQGDSKLVCNQFNGTWKVHKEHLLPYQRAAREGVVALLPPAKRRDEAAVVTGKAPLQITHVLREYNKDADRLSNVAMDAHDWL